MLTVPDQINKGQESRKMSDSCNTEGCVDNAATPLDASTHPILIKLCSRCKQAITPARLAAVPDTACCTKCVADSGDVPKIRRFDEPLGEEIISTYYQIPNQYLKTALDRQYGENAIPESFDDQDFKDGYRRRVICTE